MDKRVLAILRYGSADLAPYRDCTGSLPPGWPNWHDCIQELGDRPTAETMGLVLRTRPSRQPDLTTSGKKSLADVGFPVTTSFPEFWAWFKDEFRKELEGPGPIAYRKVRILGFSTEIAKGHLAVMLDGAPHILVSRADWRELKSFMDSYEGMEFYEDQEVPTGDDVEGSMSEN